MKLTKENINQINEVLIKEKVHYIDLRIEIIDHLSSELEQMEGEFDAIFPNYYALKRDFVKQMFISHLKSDTVKGYKLLLTKIVSWQFLGLFLCVLSIVYFAFTLLGKASLLNFFDIVPILLPTPITAIMLYTFLFSKNKSTDLTSLLGMTNLVIVTYIFGGIYLIRSTTEVIWLPLFSFYLTINIAYYFFYFSSKKKHKQKYETLIFTL